MSSGLEVDYLFVDYLSNLLLQLVLVELETILQKKKIEQRLQSFKHLTSNMLNSFSQFRTAHISICDGHTFSLDGGLSGYAAPSLLQRHLPVGESKSVRAAGPRST